MNVRLKKMNTGNLRLHVWTIAARSLFIAVLTSLSAQSGLTATKTPIADALDWYSSLDKRYFKIQISTPRARSIDAVLSAQARAAALAYVKAGGDRACLLRIPKVKSGDPFVHVYEECQGVLDAVLEFKIRQDRVEDFPQWTYDRPHKSIPVGAELRRRKPDLWFAVSTPQERKRPAR